MLIPMLFLVLGESVMHHKSLLTTFPPSTYMVTTHSWPRFHVVPSCIIYFMNQRMHEDDADHRSLTPRSCGVEH